VRISVENLPARGLELTASKSDSWALSAAVDALGAEPIALAVHVTVYQLDSAVRVRGSATAEFHTACHRCAGAISVAVGGDLDLIYRTEGTVPLELELEIDDMDVGFFDGRGLEMDAVIAEYFALQLPDVLRCDSSSVKRLSTSSACALPVQDPGPNLTRRNPFAGIVLPE
jgi:uncharacterized metal-binding protein YceD (DUF177 family)